MEKKDNGNGRENGRERLDGRKERKKKEARSEEENVASLLYKTKMFSAFGKIVFHTLQMKQKENRKIVFLKNNGKNKQSR